MNTNRELFEEAPVPKAVALMAVPTMISMLVVVIYNMADKKCVGHVINNYHQHGKQGGGSHEGHRFGDRRLLK